MPGVITTDSEGTLQTVALEIRDGLIAAIYIVRNPNKLAHIDAGGDPSCELE
jgi:RNA polymerase sigma-70 factor (ECF subfamily)